MRNTKRESPRWSLDDIPYDRINTDQLRANTNIFFILAAASFVEIASYMYTPNLSHYFHDDPEIRGWLENNWEPEEIQHGQSLKAYVQYVWPDFDWHGAYSSFLAEYSKLCTVDTLESTQALEMVARCVIEMGTSTYYGAINEYVDDPVLKQLTALIRSDEVRHYKYFYRFFLKYNAQERNSRSKILGALCRRLWEIRSSDVTCALWHVYHVRQPDQPRDGAAFRTTMGSVARVLRRNYPATMAIKMFLKPLDLPPVMQRAILQPVARVTQRLFLHEGGLRSVFLR